LRLNFATLYIWKRSGIIKIKWKDLKIKVPACQGKKGAGRGDRDHGKK